MDDYDLRRRLRDQFLSNCGRNSHQESEAIVPYESEPCPTTEFGKFITTQYTIIHQILTLMPYSDLLRATLISRDFMYAAEVELAKRSQFGGTAWAGFCMVSALKAFEMFVDSIYNPTSLSLLFTTQDPWNFFLRKDGKNFSLFEKMKELNTVLRAPMLSIVSDLGIVGTTSDLKVIQEGPLVNDSVAAFATVITIPKVQGMEVHKFKIKMIHARRLMNIDHKKRPEWLFQRIKGPNKPIRCILFFINEGIQIEPGVMFKSLQNRQREKLVIGGAFIPPYMDFDESRRPYGIEGVAFYGDNIEASSLALTLGHKSPEDVDGRMSEFANGVKRGKVNLCLMFTCCGRGLVSGRSTERTFFDSESYQKHFPTTPLHGIVGLGEIGCDWFPMENGIPKSKISDPEWIRTFVQQQYASVFVHLAFGLDTYEDKLLPAHQTATMVMTKRFGTQPDLDIDDQLDDPPQGSPQGKVKENLKEAGDLQAEAVELPLMVEGPGTSGESGC